MSDIERRLAGLFPYEARAAKEESVAGVSAGQPVDNGAWDECFPPIATPAEALSYWRTELAEPPFLHLPTDFPRPIQPADVAAHVGIVLPAVLVARLREIAAREQTTLFSALLAVFAALLHRYTGDEDIVVGCPVAGRTRLNTKRRLETRIDTLPFRVRLAPADTFRRLLRRVHECVARGLQHQELFSPIIVEDVSAERDAGRAPLFQATFVHGHLPFQSRAAAGATCEPKDYQPATTSVDLSLELIESSTRLGGLFVYRRDLWDHVTIERMVGHFLNLLDGIVADADQRISEVSLLTERERHQLLVEWNATAVAYPDDKCVHELFEEQVVRTPGAVAVVFEDRELTYGELNQRANQLAHYLRRLGVGPETLVGLCLDRSLELVVGILGILKAGGAYVPLDADFPPHRSEFMMADAQVGILVTQHRLLGRVRVNDCQVVCLDNDATKVREMVRSNPAPNVGADNLAYVMYTSGSTGQPKGVATRHRSIARLLFGNNYTSFGPDCVFLQLATVSFDASTFELWGPLLHGAKLVVAPVGLPDFRQLEDVLKRHRVTTLWLTSTMLNHVVEKHPQALDSLNEILTGGESLSVRHIRMAQAALGSHVHLINGYGPTETTTFATCYRIPSNVAKDVESVPIGRPLANTRVYVLDERRQPVPIGVAGELYIGGAGLARDYLNRPELTAEKFVANPFDEDRNSRLYRTGDVCRWRGDGNLEFLGRLDDQVKLRGFRIEPGEIEAVLSEQATVAQAVVTLREDRAGDKRLVAYCVAVAATELDFAELRSNLRQRLPDYMVPAAFVALESLPLTASGKVDRRALPAPDETRPDLASGYVAPRDPIEEQLASIWGDVLGIHGVGIHDNFFALGGHSLLVMRIHARMTATLEVSLPLNRLFEAPTIAELAREVETLRRGEPSPLGTALQRVDRAPMDRLPLSFAQQRLWFLEQLEGELTAYNIPYGWKLQGSLDAEALRRALETIVKRHEPLRTTFAVVEGDPVQVIGTVERLELPLEDLRSLAPAQREKELARRCRLEAERPFDLSGDQMIRASLVRLSENEHVLLLTMHHIASDGWSLHVLWRELDLLYGAFCQGMDAGLPKLPVQYVDYAVWHRNELQGRRLELLLEYWRQQLAGLSVLELPSDRPRPAVPTYLGAQRGFALKEELVEQLKALSRTEGVTLQMTLLAAFQALLARYSGQNDIAVGTPTAGRHHAQLEDQIGFFVNMLVLRTDLSGDPTFRELLSRIRQVSFAAYGHQDLPFEKLVEELQPERQRGRNPLVQVLFQLMSFAGQDLALRDLEVVPLPPSSQRVRFDLEMHLWQQPKSLGGVIIYSTALFDDSTIERLVGHFLTLLEGIVTDADRRLSRLPLLTEWERHQLLVEWNDTAVAYPRDKCVHELFEEQVERTPAAVAVVFEDRELTYRELNQRANQLAHFLRGLGVGPETLVGLCLDRSLELVVGILGILKAGGAYMPLDADYPPQRSKFMLADAQVGILVTQHRSLGRLRVNDCQIVCLDSDAAKVREMVRSNPAPNVGADNLAYVIYTSGSTGQPKGVSMPHGALVNLIHWHWCHPRLRQPARTLQFASCNFDVSFQEMFTTWCCGGTLVLISEVVRRDPRSLWRLIVESRVSRLFVPYVVLQQLAAIADDVVAELRDIVSAGEALQLTPEIRRLVRDHNCRLHNHYGPTESHVVTALVLGNEPETWPPAAPIGRPIANTRVYVLDAQRQPVPIGVSGELYIGGACLARGYFNQPELTVEKFVANPLEDGGNSRLYRTGDVCRWRGDGNLAFLGRLDDQVKLRGFRIEPGEIEAVLSEQATVAQAVVTLREDRPGDKRLVAYCVAVAATELDFAELRSNLRQRLPDYMVPAAFVALESLPLTASGKVDRRALPAPDETRPDLASGYVAPHDSIEEQLASIWGDVLGIHGVGIHDNFFALGGHSLLVMRIHARMTAALEVSLPLNRLFEAPTIAELAREIETARRGGLSPLGTTLQRVDRAPLDRLPLSFAQQRLWFLEQLEGELTAYNIPYGWKLQGSLDGEALRRALETIVKRHEPLRTTFAVVEGEPVQVIGTIERLELPLEDLRSLAPEQREAELTRRCRLEAERPFDLSGDQMLRASVLRLSEKEHVLLLTMHHIASDGWSLHILWRELALLYDAFCQGMDAGFPKLPVHYADYAVWQRNELQGRRLELLLEYWRQQLAGLNALELPSDRPRPAVPTYLGAQRGFELNEELVEQLKALSRAEGVTLQMTLLAAFQALLARNSGQDDIAVGTPTAGRHHALLEDQIGFFVNMLVLRTDLSGDPTFRELLGRVRRVSLAAYDHQDLPFEKLVEELQPARHLGRSPLVQVLFQLMSFAGQDLALRDLEVVPLPPSSQRVRFDLEMHLWQQPKSLAGVIVYSTALFDDLTIERLAGHFLTLLEGIVADAEQRISEVSLLTERERHQLLVEFNATALAYPDDKCVHELFEEQVERTPGAVAVVFENQELTYRELNQRANQLAHYLRSLGVGPETLVGLCLDRSPELVVGVLGILKAGGAYVPLDADFPPRRLEFMLRDSAVKYLVTQRHLQGRLPVTMCRTILLDPGHPVIAEGAAGNPRSGIGANNLAYAMYTSGSTGQPKGVAITHQSICNLFMGIHPLLKTEVGTRFLGIASPTFDISVAEMFLPLIAGATTILVRKETARDVATLAETIAASRPHIVQATPASWRSLLDFGWRGSDKLILVSTGEALPGADAERLLGVCGTLYDFYGPTEATIWSTAHQVARAQGGDLIGGPLANTQLYVLDQRRQPVPIGVPGELYIGGVGLARGYLHRPELTAEKFVSNPFNAGPVSRLYRSGDLCRWRADGIVEYLGRLDHQIKLRGLRIEAGEIETLLNEHPSVAHSVVMLREDRPGDNRLVAYCVAAADTELDFSQLRSELRQRLPDYMVPAAFVALDTLPLTASGKIDRRALPAPDETRPDLAKGYIAPRDPLEEQLASIWGDVLGIRSVGIHDNFFALGGHSFLVAKMIDILNRKFSSALKMTTVFQRPTIAELALALTPVNSRAGEKSLVAPRREGRFLCVLREGTQPGTIICVGGNVAQAFSKMRRQSTILQLDLDGIHSKAYRGLSVSEVATAYADEILAAKLMEPIVMIGYSYGGLLAYALAHCLRDRKAFDFQLVMIEPTTSAKAQNATKKIGGDPTLRQRLGAPVLDRKSQPSRAYRWLRSLYRPLFGLGCEAARLRIGLALAMGHSVSIEQRWYYYTKTILKKVEAYQPSKRLSGRIHLVCGREWTRASGQTWREQFLNDRPVMHDLGEATHHDLVKCEALTDFWRDLVYKLCYAR